jgi:general secretion pathway protein G
LKKININKAFSLLELIFVILIISILSSIILSNILPIQNSIKIQECKTTLNSIKKSILQHKNKNILQNTTHIFDISKHLNHSWQNHSQNKYYYLFKNEKLLFTFNKNDNTFTCDINLDLCKKVMY